jgi:hypothetical protein
MAILTQNEIIVICYGPEDCNLNVLQLPDALRAFAEEFSIDEEAGTWTWHRAQSEWQKRRPKPVILKIGERRPDYKQGFYGVIGCYNSDDLKQIYDMLWAGVGSMRQR